MFLYEALFTSFNLLEFQQVRGKYAKTLFHKI
ncbi:hypothetical protein [Helicobacter pylori]